MHDVSAVRPSSGSSGWPKRRALNLSRTVKSWPLRYVLIVHLTTNSRREIVSCGSSYWEFIVRYATFLKTGVCTYIFIIAL